MLLIRLLGRFELHLDDQPIAVSSRVAQALLAYLSLHPGTKYRREKLAGLFWPGTSDPNSRQYLRQAMWRIRRALSDAAPILQSKGFHIWFNEDAEYWIDTRVLENRDPGWESIEALVESVSQYQGEFLAGQSELWVRTERERLFSVFEQKMDRLLEALVGERRWREAIEWSTHWLRHAPADEPAYRYLMMAYGEMGDRSRVAATYLACVESLRNALGVKPSEETEALLESLMGEVPSESAGGPGGEPAGLAWWGGGIPLPSLPIIDRELDLRQIETLLADPTCRLLSLVGVGGSGKTRLAIEVGLRWRECRAGGAVYFVPLGELRSGDQIPDAIAQAVTGQFPDACDPVGWLADVLPKQETLLVLDCFEHLLDGVAIVGDLQCRCASVKILVTSRERLSLQGERVVEVSGLSVPSTESRDDVEAAGAPRLFLEVARRLDPAYSLSTRDVRELAQLCWMTDGLPLALELAASWTRLLSCSEIAAQVKRNIRFLSTTRRDISARHRSLHAAFEHSWDLLNGEERRLLRELAVFRGGFERRAAAFVAGATPETLSLLVDKSLLLRMGDQRLGFHGLVLEFAREKLAKSGEGEAVARRHRDWFLALAEERRPRLWGAAHTAVLDELDTEWHNLQAALDWTMVHGNADERLRLVVALSWFWYVRGSYTEARRWHELALTAEQEARPLLRAQLMYMASAFFSQQGDCHRAETLSRQSLSLLDEIDSLWDRGWALSTRGYALLGMDQPEQALACFAEAESVFREENDREGAFTMMLYQGISQAQAGQVHDARQLLGESLKGLRELNDTVGIARALHCLGELALRQADQEAALTCFRESLAASRPRVNRPEIAQCLEGLAIVLFKNGDASGGARLLGAAESIRRYLGTRPPSSTHRRLMDLFSQAEKDMPKADLATARHEAQSLTADQAVALALSLSVGLT